MNIHCQCVMKYQVLISCPTLEDYNFGCANTWAIYIKTVMNIQIKFLLHFLMVGKRDDVLSFCVV